MTSINVCRLHEPSLLFDETGSKLRRARWNRVVSRTAKQFDCAIVIELTKLFPSAPLEFEVADIKPINPNAPLPQGGFVGSNPIFVVDHEFTISAFDYFAFFGLGLASAGLGIAVMKGVTSTEALFRRQAVPPQY